MVFITKAWRSCKRHRGKLREKESERERKRERGQREDRERERKEGMRVTERE